MEKDDSSPGPITWCVIIATTCVLLFLLQKILWLVVPFFLALVLYYLLDPFAKKMVLSGHTHNFAAATLSGIFLLATINVLLFLYPMVLSHIDSWQDTMSRYMTGGYSLIDSILTGLEQQFNFARNAHMADSMRSNVTALQDNFAQHYLGTLILGIAAWLPSLLLIPMVAYFLLKESNHFRQFLGLAVPNAFFEKTLYLSHAIDRAARLYFVGLIKLAAIDTFMLILGFWLLDFPAPIFLGIVVGILGQVPYVGPLIGCILALLVSGTDFPGDVSTAYNVVILFLVIRLLDDFLLIPSVVGKSLNLHPLLSILMLFVGGTIAGIAGLMLVLPILGIVMLLGETLEIILTDKRLMARHAYAVQLRELAAKRDLILPN
ncbi:MAG: AI-2E family transporter [Methylophilales bacterium]|nr:AI-2E family transporter [Methylophilales bacterium]